MPIQVKEVFSINGEFSRGSALVGLPQASPPGSMSPGPQTAMPCERAGRRPSSPSHQGVMVMIVIEWLQYQYIGMKAINLLKQLSGYKGGKSLPEPIFVTQDTGEGVLWAAGDVAMAFELDPIQVYEVLRTMDEFERLQS